MPPEIRRVQDTEVDTRPYPSVCSIFAFQEGDDVPIERGTGWVVGPRMVITAAHVVCDIEGNMGQPDIAFARAEARFRWHQPNIDPLATLVVQKILPHPSYAAGVPDANRLDIALLFFGVDLPGPSSALQPTSATNAELATARARIVGYPVKVPDTPIPPNARTLFASSGRISTALAAHVTYDVLTQPGQSGAPILLGALHDERVAGIHLSGPDDFLPANHGLRFTAPIINWINGVQLVA